MYNIVQEDVEFDLNNAKACINTYSRSVGVNCFLINNYGENLHSSCGNSGKCGFCSKIQEILGATGKCKNAHLYGGYQAERFGGKYIYFCPFGLTHWASPIASNGMMKGAILGGPVLMIEHEEFLMEDVIGKYNIDEKYIDELRSCINDIPIVEPDRVSSLSEALFIFASFISDVQPSKYIEEREYNEQQSNISEYIHYIKTMGGEEDPKKEYPLEKERELLSLITRGDKEGSQKILNEIFGYIFFSTGGNFEVIKSRVLELIVLLSRAALEGGADVEQIFGLNYKYLSQINKFEKVEDLTFWLSKIMVRFTDCVFNLKDVKNVDVIYKAIDYVKKNYMKKVSLEEVASYVYLSPSYFSKVFKDEMKSNFNTYLNKVRIDMSKKLLSDSSIPLVDIANLVGYEDQSYFTKVFKKIVGVSPGKYRETRGRISVK